MTDYPIIFSAPMILALLAGRKTMTRRIAVATCKLCGTKDGSCRGPHRPSSWQRVKPGDRLWVRENLCQRQGEFLGIKQNVIEARYAADEAEVLDQKEFNLCPWWKADGDLPSIHMPRSVSRLTLVVTGTKVERLLSISEDDAVAEGIEFRDGCFGTWNPDGTMRCGGAENAWQAFRCLWLNLHGAGAWESNPEVVAISFKVVQANIDRVSPGSTHVGALAKGA